MRKKNKGYFFTPPVVLPPHTRALKELDKIKQSKIWQQNREKEFYTSVTDVLRKYILERFNINALEMTSSEIIDKVKNNSQIESDSAVDNLQQVLQLADMVKFAKQKPLQDENDLSLMNAFFFVTQTKEVDLSEEEGKEENEKNS